MRQVSPSPAFDEAATWAEVKRWIELLKRAQNRQIWLFYASAVPALALSPSPLAAIPVLAAATLGRFSLRRAVANAEAFLCPRCHQPFLEVSNLGAVKFGPYRVFSKSADCQNCGLTVGEIAGAKTE